MANGTYAVIGLLIGLVLLGMLWFYMLIPAKIAIAPIYTPSATGIQVAPAVEVPVVPAVEVPVVPAVEVPVVPAVEVPVVPVQPIDPLSMFILSKNKACKKRNELGYTIDMSAEDCAKRCLDNPECISFEIKPSSGKCQFSTSCNSDIATKYSDYNLYTRK